MVQLQGLSEVTGLDEVARLGPHEPIMMALSKATKERLKRGMLTASLVIM